MIYISSKFISTHVCMFPIRPPPSPSFLYKIKNYWNDIVIIFIIMIKIPTLRIHLILTWIRILGSTFGNSGSGSSDPPFRNSGSGSSDPHLEKVDPDPVPKWIRIRVPIFHIFHKEIHVGQITMLILLPPKFRKGISQITKTFSFTFYSK